MDDKSEITAERIDELALKIHKLDVKGGDVIAVQKEEGVFTTEELHRLTRDLDRNGLKGLRILCLDAGIEFQKMGKERLLDLRGAIDDALASLEE